MAQVLAAQRSAPDCNAIKNRRQAIDDGPCTKSSPAGLIRIAALALHGFMRRFAMARRRRATLLGLQSLDAHTLNDLGLDHSEIPSAVAELFGEVDVARTRFVQPR